MTPSERHDSSALNSTRELNRSRRQERVLQAALRVIADKGLEETRMADISRLAGMSSGHVMYYFPTKSALLMRALEWSEDRFLALTEAAIETVAGALEQLTIVVENSVPASARDPAWILWLEAWAHAPHDSNVATINRRVEARWVALVSRVVEEGQAAGEFASVDVRRFVILLSALIDGLSIRMLGGDDDLTREELLRHCGDLARAELIGLAQGDDLPRPSL